MYQYKKHTTKPKSKAKSKTKQKTGFNKGGWVENKAIPYGKYIFKSELEVDFYKFLEKFGIDAEYEPITFETWEGCDSTIRHYYAKKGTSNLRKIGGDLDNIEYTPDFHFKYKNVDVFVETKGKEREDFTIRKKLFLKLMNVMYPNSYYFVIKSIHQAQNMMEILEFGKIVSKGKKKKS